MYSMNKKGISDIIAGIMIMGMSVVALTLLGTFLFGLAGETAQLAPAVSCFEMTSKIESVCYEEQNLQIKLRRGLSDEGITSFRFSIESAGTADSYYCGGTCGSCEVPGQGETKTLYLTLANAPEKVTFFANEKCNLGTKDVRAC